MSFTTVIVIVFLLAVLPVAWAYGLSGFLLAVVLYGGFWLGRIFEMRRITRELDEAEKRLHQ